MPYDVSIVKTLAAAMGRPASAHDYVITNYETGHVKGVYATEALAVTALRGMVTASGIYILTVLHPDQCRCEVPTM